MILLKTSSLVYFQYFCLLELLAFAHLLILSGLKVKKLFEKRFENKHFNDVSKIHVNY